MGNVGLMGPDPSIVMTVLRSRLFTNLDPMQWPTSGVSPLNKAILVIVSLSILAAVLESESSLRNTYPFIFEPLNVLFAVLFLVEYLLPPLGDGRRPSVRWLSRSYSIRMYNREHYRLGGNSRPLGRYHPWHSRNVRRRAAIGSCTSNNYIGAQQRMGRRHPVTRNRDSNPTQRTYPQFRSYLVNFARLCDLPFCCRRNTQPEAFGSIPRAMWWAMATLTTVGYGDVYPITAIGKLFAGISAITSIAIVAMPTGIMAAAFSDVFQLLRKDTD